MSEKCFRTRNYAMEKCAILKWKSASQLTLSQRSSCREIFYLKIIGTGLNCVFFFFFFPILFSRRYVRIKLTKVFTCLGKRICLLPGKEQLLNEILHENLIFEMARQSSDDLARRVLSYIIPVGTFLSVFFFFPSRSIDESSLSRPGENPGSIVQSLRFRTNPLVLRFSIPPARNNNKTN